MLKNDMVRQMEFIVEVPTANPPVTVPQCLTNAPFYPPTSACTHPHPTPYLVSSPNPPPAIVPFVPPTPLDLVASFSHSISPFYTCAGESAGPLHHHTKFAD
jgi:hypothetical protein